jgi:predicted DNA-binding ribbon-helix-helix protein
MKSSVVKRSVVLAGHKTSVSLEDAFWQGLKDIATSRRTTLGDLINSIDLDRQQGNLSSALRCSYSITIRRQQRHISATADRTPSSRTCRTEPSTSRWMR